MKGPVIYYPIAEMYGEQINTSKSAIEFKISILEDLDTDLKVELDFIGVKTIKPLWISKSLGSIVKEKGMEFFIDNIRMINYIPELRKGFRKIIGDVLESEPTEA